VLLFQARVIFDKATKVNFKMVEDLANVWCEYTEMELRHEWVEYQLLNNDDVNNNVEIMIEHWNYYRELLLYLQREPHIMIELVESIIIVLFLVCVFH
jgi:hypothetical protein